MLRSNSPGYAALPRSFRLFFDACPATFALHEYRLLAIFYKRQHLITALRRVTFPSSTLVYGSGVYVLSQRAVSVFHFWDPTGAPFSLQPQLALHALSGLDSHFDWLSYSSLSSPPPFFSLLELCLLFPRFFRLQFASR